MYVRRVSVVALALTLSAFAGCGSSSSDTAAPEGEPESISSSESTSEDEPEEVPGDECLPVPGAMLRAIAKGGDGVKIKPVSGAAVRSDDFEKVWMIAMEFDGVGSTERGVWASNSMKPGSGMILSVDGMAQEFTVWPNGTADSPMSIADHGAQEALDCL